MKKIILFNVDSGIGFDHVVMRVVMHLLIQVIAIQPYVTVWTVK